MAPLTEAICVAFGGAAGALSRFAMQKCDTVCIPGLPPTVSVNLMGCLAIGIMWALLHAFGAPLWLNRLIIAGFLGGYTTFSSFSLDFVTLADSGRWATATAYAALSMAGGIALCWAGLKGTTWILASITD